MMSSHRIAVIPGDGIGKEVVPAAIRVLDAVAQACKITLHWEHFDWSCERYLSEGEMMPSDGIERLSKFDAIFLGAVGFPGVPDQISLWGLLIPIRRSFDQYINLRPCRMLPGINSPLHGVAAGEIDYYIVRENTEGEYSSIGGRLFEGTDRELVVQESVFTRRGVDRVLRYAFELAQKRGKRLTSATKSNGIMYTMPYWDERVKALSASFPDVEVEQFHIDILCAHLVQRPKHFDVVVGSNLFGDILSDLGPATTGSIGIAPSANLNPDGRWPSMFEPVHGSAPDIAGKGIANPIGAVWAGAMMLGHLGHHRACDAILVAIENALLHGKGQTRDVGGTASTKSSTAAVAEAALKHLNQSMPE